MSMGIRCEFACICINVSLWLLLTLVFLLACHPGDQMGECRAHGNLGSAFFSKGNYREALTNHRHQLMLAMKLKDREVGGAGLGVSCTSREAALLGSAASAASFCQLRGG